MTAGEGSGLGPGMPVDEIPVGNRLLDGLDAADAALLLPHLEPVTLLPGQILGETGHGQGWAIFPCHPAVVALVGVTEDGRTAEAASVGSEGLLCPWLVGLPGFGQLRVQLPGPALRLAAGPLTAAIAGSAALREGVAAHDRALLTQTMQSVVCAALHPVEARTSTWLLLAQDRMGQDELPVTQESLSELLGVRRTTITRVMAQLAAKGVIRHRRSRVTIIDRAGLEAIACGCHHGLVHRLQHVAPALFPLGPKLRQSAA